MGEKQGDQAVTYRERQRGNYRQLEVSLALGQRGERWREKRLSSLQRRQRQQERKLEEQERGQIGHPTPRHPQAPHPPLASLVRASSAFLRALIARISAFFKVMPSLL